MNTIEEYVIELNNMINTHQIKMKKVLKPLLFEFDEKFRLKYKFINLIEYDSEDLKIAKQEKIKYAKNQRFAIAAIFRDLEKKCLEINHIKKEYNISKSEFRYAQGYLLYLCCNSTYVDFSIRDYFGELNNINNIK